MAEPRVVLASTSPRRRDLLGRLGLVPEVRPVEVDETPRDAEDAHDLVLRLAAAKAEAGARGDDAEVVLAADTVVVLDGVVLGKPRDPDHARTMLTALAGRTHEVVTGVAAVRGRERRRVRVTTAVTFRSLSRLEIDWYLATGEPVDKAGSYALQGAGAVLVRSLTGSDTNVVGLPLAETVTVLRELGVDPLR